jgi:2,3-bisphosphoglycerate-dependent phosphoglycerate mutase
MVFNSLALTLVLFVGLANLSCGFNFASTTVKYSAPAARKGTGYATDEGYSRLVESRSLWRRIFPRADPGRAHLKEASRMMGMGTLLRRRPKKPGTLILVRNGESQANTTFCGWNDPDISDKGLREVQHAGRLLREAGYDPDVVFTSRLKRAIHSTWAILREMDTIYLPVFKSWRLNGRHYGSLTGLSKAEVAETFGADLVQQWRTDPKAVPPPMDATDPFWTANERKFADVANIPTAESLADCMERIGPLWRNKIQAELKAGHNVLVVSHATTLRGLIKHVQGILDDDANVYIPPGIPLVYDFDDKLEAIKPDDKRQNESWAKFLEKPGLLDEALKEEKYRMQHVPGYKTLTDDGSRPMNSLEQSLMKLSAERELAYQLNKEIILTEEKQLFQRAIHNVADRISTAKLQIISHPPFLTKSSGGSNMIDELALPSRKVATIVMVRHGKTEHNKLGLFTGWQDPPLAPEGVDEARKAGKLLAKYGFEFDVVYTSWLSRAIETAWLILDELDSTWLPIVKSWRLNERNYGGLTGKSKKMIARIFGNTQFKRWRRGFDVRPPPLSSFSHDFPGNHPRYQKFMTDVRYSWSDSLIRSIEFRRVTLTRKFPKTESLRDCNRRTIPFFVRNIMPQAVKQSKRVLIASSENAIRGLLMYLCDIPEEKIAQLNIPNGIPIIYDVSTRTLTLIQDGVQDPLEMYDFGVAAEYLFQRSGNVNGAKLEVNRL